MSVISDFEDRVLQFQMLSLPGQPQAMHMGTSYLINDLFQEVKRLNSELNERIQLQYERK